MRYSKSHTKQIWFCGAQVWNCETDWWKSILFCTPPRSQIQSTRAQSLFSNNKSIKKKSLLCHFVINVRVCLHTQWWGLSRVNVFFSTMYRYICSIFECVRKYLCVVSNIHASQWSVKNYLWLQIINGIMFQILISIR